MLSLVVYIIGRRKEKKMKKSKEHKKSCTPRCWFAKRDKCECVCNGINHKIGERASKTSLKDMENNYKEYKRVRREERKLLRAGLTPKAPRPRLMTSSFLMKAILGLGKQVKG